METRVVASDAIGAAGAAFVEDVLAASDRTNATVMAALGTSPLPIYAELARRRAVHRGPSLGAFGRVAASPLDTIVLVQLDEYLGIEPDDPRSLGGWLRTAVARPLGVDEARIVSLAGDAPDADVEADAACRAYDRAVAAAGGIDIAILGLGPNGHLGFNEPPSPSDAPTRRVPLSAASLASNARYWPGAAVPEAALTAGMDVILGARRVLLVVTGSTKRSILRRLLVEPVGPGLPASFLRAHPAATLLCDAEAWPDDLAGGTVSAT